MISSFLHTFERVYSVPVWTWRCLNWEGSERTVEGFYDQNPLMQMFLHSDTPKINGFLQDPDSVQPSLMACCMDNSQRTGETICSANILTMSWRHGAATHWFQTYPNLKDISWRKNKSFHVKQKSETSLQNISDINTCNIEPT